jgi:hypothetical protein
MGVQMQTSHDDHVLPLLGSILPSHYQDLWEVIILMASHYLRLMAGHYLQIYDFVLEVVYHFLYDFVLEVVYVILKCHIRDITPSG